MEPFLYQQELDALQTQLPDQRGGKRPAFRPTAQPDLDWLASVGIPETVRLFFATAEPAGEIESEGVYLLPIAKLQQANSQAVPGIAASKYGCIVVANTVSGDAYCIDINQAGDEGQPPVYIVNHERVWEEASLEELQQHRHLVTNSFREFLRRFAEGTLPYDYYDAAEGW